MQALIAKQIDLNKAKKDEGGSAISHEKDRLAEQEQREYDRRLARAEQFTRQWERLEIDATKLAEQRSEFWVKELEKETKSEGKEWEKRNAAEIKFRDERLKDRENESLSKIATEEKPVQEQFRLGNISAEQEKAHWTRWLKRN